MTLICCKVTDWHCMVFLEGKRIGKEFGIFLPDCMQHRVSRKSKVKISAASAIQIKLPFYKIYFDLLAFLVCKCILWILHTIFSAYVCLT